MNTLTDRRSPSQIRPFMGQIASRDKRELPAGAGSASQALPVRWALFAGLMGPVVAAFCIAVEPPPANPNAPEPLIGTLLALALMAAWVGAAVSAVRRRPGALRWASLVGALSVAMTISCPLTGHHTNIGMWLAAQFLVSGGAWAVAAGGAYTMRLRQAEAQRG